MSEITIGDYLLQRLKEMGIEHVFGVPGDYNLEFLDQIVNFPGLEWIGNCNELNGAYAADGYARIKGISALVTTFGVGELSAINGIAGAYAERIPIINIVGVPSTSLKNSKALVHHSLGDGDFNVFQKMFQNVTIAHTWLNEEQAGEEIDRVLRQAWIKKQPVYIALPSDVAFKKISTPQHKLDLSFPPSNKDAVDEVVSRAVKMIQKALSPVVLIDACATRFPMKSAIENFLNTTGLPFATMNMAKGVIDENHLQFIGSYIGALSDETVRKYVEESDCLISFGALLSDLNTGGFTSKLDANVTIEIHSYHTRIRQATYQNVLFCDVIPQLTKNLDNYHYNTLTIKKQILKSYHQKDTSIITQHEFWHKISLLLKENCTILAESGTAMFGAMQITLPPGAHYISQTLWGSIGYSVGAFLGVSLAAPERQNILLVGDGAFQLTAQEISTMLRHHQTSTIFLLNNNGYTVERAIHGAEMIYNDIQMWNYAHLPFIFGEKVWSVRVETPDALEQALHDIDKHPDRLKFIEVVMDKMDSPEILRALSKQISDVNYK